MDSIINLLFPLLSTAKNYDDVLKKLPSLAFYDTYLTTPLPRSHPLAAAFLASIESWGPVGKVSASIPHADALNLSGIVIAFAVAVLTHMFQFHDRISDVFGIRRRFDVRHILIPLATRLHVDFPEDKEAK